MTSVLENLRNIQIGNIKSDEAELLKILLDTSDFEVIDLICSILRKSIRSGNCAAVDVSMLIPGLRSLNDNVLSLTLEYISYRQPIYDQETLQNLVGLLDHRNQSVVELAMNALVAAADGPVNVENFFEFIQPLMQQQLDSENIVSFELVARWCQKSANFFKACSNYGMIAFATEFSPSSDILLSLTIIELFKEISKTEAGFSFLVQTGVLQKLSSILFAEDVSELVLVSTVKFWGWVSFYQPKQLELMDSMKIFSRITELQTPALREAVVVAIGNIGSSTLGLIFLSDRSNLLIYYLKELFPYTTGDLKVDCLKTLACLLDHRDQAKICARIFHLAFDDQEPIGLLISFSKSSILDVSVASFACLTNICNFDWGCRMIANSPSFNYFLERKPEVSSIVKEWKFSILKAILSYPNSEEMFAPSVYTKIAEFVRDGPFKLLYNPQVSFETS